MYFVYIIKSLSQGVLYIGYTGNFKQRLEIHNQGLSSHTKKYLPWKLVYCEGYSTKDEAIDRERKLKQFGKVYSQLKRRIKPSLES